MLAAAAGRLGVFRSVWRLDGLGAERGRRSACAIFEQPVSALRARLGSTKRETTRASSEWRDVVTKAASRCDGDCMVLLLRHIRGVFRSVCMRSHACGGERCDMCVVSIR